jgi:hypothetical protein
MTGRHQQAQVAVAFPVFRVYDGTERCQRVHHLQRQDYLATIDMIGAGYRHTWNPFCCLMPRLNRYE